MITERILDVEKELQRYLDSENHQGAEAYLDGILHETGLPAAVRGRVHHLRGRAFYHRQEWKRAETDFHAALELATDDWFSLFYLGRIAEETGQGATALAIYARCLAEQPSVSHLSDFMIGLLGKHPTGIRSIDAKPLPRPENLRSNTPLVSIFVLCYNKVEYTARCLRALIQNTQEMRYEVILVDNASSDDTPALLESYSRRMTYVRTPKNLGFVGGNNEAANHARGEYVVFLNNDTEPKAGWLTELYQTFVRDPGVGAAGSMLIYPDGRLQEAGGAIFNDATGWNYGKGGVPNSHLYSFSREVDYCSGASLMVRRDLFEKLGRFDERFAPAYFEDTDLCFGIRKLGYKVMYCPMSQVVHYEGITAGTDLNSGFKRFQVINTPKFQEKWASELGRQYPPDQAKAHFFSNRSKGKRVLIIDDLPPLPDRAAGSLRMYHTVRQMLGLGYQITYVHLTGARLDEAARKHMFEFMRQGVEFIWFEYELWWADREKESVKPRLEALVKYLELKNRAPEMIYICFWHIAGYFIDQIRKAAPDVPVIVDSMDLHFLREQRQAEVTKDPALRKKAEQTKVRELEVYRKADAVTTVTLDDRAALRKEIPDKAVLIMTDVHDPVSYRVDFERRKDLVYVGNFNHTPNEDAVLWFVKDIFPLVRREIPEIRFLIVGNNPTEKVKKLASDSIVVTGWVPEMKPFLDQCRVEVVPLRYGAGNKGKVGEALAHGLPIVTTAIGAEGMNILPDVHAYVADDPEEFARKTIQLYRDGTAWRQFSDEGKRLIGSQYSSSMMRKRAEFLASFRTRREFISRRATTHGTPPRVSIVIPVFNQWEYTRQCLESIRQNTPVNHEVIVVDNASTDATPRSLRDYPEVRIITNPQNVGFPGAVNQGLRAALGEHLLILNNDTVVTAGWLDRLIAVAESDPSIGIVGPVSNSVSGIQLDRGASYADIPAMHAYAAGKAAEREGKTLAFPRVAFLCTLVKRNVLDAIGGLDERFAPGNFEDDDFCLRAQLAGFKTVVAHDVFIHHFGSMSFKATGNQAYGDCLAENQRRFEAKWGSNPDGIWLKEAKFRRRNPRIPNDRDDFVRHFERARILLEEQDIAPAYAELLPAVESFHLSAREGMTVEYPDVLTLAGAVAVMQGDLGRARELYEEELRLTPTSARPCLGLARVFRGAGVMDAASTMVDAAKHLAPDDPAIAAEEAALQEAMVAAEE
jgi:O-antigen biosynthesis protein